MQLNQAISRLESSQHMEKDRPYVVLCLFVLKQAIQDARPRVTHSTSKRTEYAKNHIKHITDDARRFINSSGFDTWFKASGIKSVSSHDIRKIAESPHRLFFARTDERGFNNL